MAQRKETKKKIKIRDLTPRKDAKAGSTQPRNTGQNISHQGSQSSNRQINPNIHI